MNGVLLTEYPEVYGLTRKKRDERYESADKKAILVNPEQVGAILPRKEYTTLIIQGLWVHVAHSFEETRDLLGFES